MADGAPPSDGFVAAVLGAGGSLATIDQLFESAEFGVFVDRVDAGCTYVNQAFADMFGLARADCLGFGWARPIHPDDVARLQDRIATFEETQVPTQVEYRTVHDGGDARWVRATVRAILGDAGEHLGSFAILEDITRERRFRDRSLESQKLEVVGRLAGRVAHDFNNLLTAVFGSTHLLGMRDDVDEDMQDILQTLHDVGEQGRYLTEQLLTLSRQRVDRPSALDVDQALGGLGRVLRRSLGEGMSVELDLGADGARIPLDAGQLGQLVLNLTLNARDAAEGRGRVQIRTRRDADLVALSVVDDGPGMDEATRARVFEPFFTTKAPSRGTGLGLATVKEIVEAHGGRAELETAPGQGACFTLSLPVVEVDPRAPRLDAKTVSRLEGHGVVLLVEDVDPIRLIAGHALALLGYDVVAGGTLASAKQRLAERGQLPDLVVSDVMLPDGTGLELLADLRRQGYRGRAVLTSGLVGDADVEEALKDRRLSFVAKPYTVVQLLEAVAAAAPAEVNGRAG